MKYGLGIDTGGTYTDAVIYDFETEGVLHTAKSITVKEDLAIGINNTIDQLPKKLFDRIQIVSLSTTLATNACVEGKGSRAKLILIGCDPEIAERYGSKYGLPDVSDIIFLKGGHGQKGEIIDEPDWDFLKMNIDACKDEVDAFAVVELWGIRNPDFEIKAKDLVVNRTAKQAVCGHELTGEINSLRRAASTLLNARLIPIINEFMNAVKRSLDEKGLRIPMAIVRGDGSLMSEEYARTKPVETLISGPSASVLGGIKLTGEKDCIVIDMGGTTSDLAVVRNGRPELTPEGANIGEWKTGTKSILVRTFGIGGDSLITYRNGNNLKIGPVRAAPLAWLAGKWPRIVEKIRFIYENKNRHTVSLCEFFYLIRDISQDLFYSEEEVKIISALRDGPLNILDLADAAETSVHYIELERLERLGIIMRCGLTPTDIMHITGDFTAWNTEAANLGALIMARQLNMEKEQLIRRIYENIKEELYQITVKLLLEEENNSFFRNGTSGQFNNVLTMSYEKGRGRNENTDHSFTSIMPEFSTMYNLVGIGAPIHIFLPDVAKILKTDCIIPDNADVANAVGAITGNVVVEENVLIRPRMEAFYKPQNENSATTINRYLVFSSRGKNEFFKFSEAVTWAKEKAYQAAGETAHSRGSENPDIQVSVKDTIIDMSKTHTDTDSFMISESFDITSDTAQVSDEDTEDIVHMETIVTARAVGKIKWI